MRRGSRGGSPSAAARSRPGSELELRSGPLREELEALAGEGVQSLLLEGGPTLAASFLQRGSRRQAARLRGADRLGRGPVALAGLDAPATLRRLTARRVGEDVLLSAYVHEP